MVSKKSQAAVLPPSLPTLPKTQPPIEHLQILQQRFESLISSIVTLKEEVAIIPGVDEWPALLHRYSNLLSHVYSISSSLISPSPHFLPSQLASFNKILEAEAKNANLYANVQDSTTLFDPLTARNRTENRVQDQVRATADGLPELTFQDPNNQLASLVAHPLLPIMEEKLNFLGTILRTAPEPEIVEEENRLVEQYEADRRRAQALQDPSAAPLIDQNDGQSNGSEEAELERVQEEISQHDILALCSLRMWYHLQQAPDEDGNAFNFKERLPKEEEDDDDDEEEEEEEEDEDPASNAADDDGDIEMQEKQSQQEKPSETKPRIRTRKQIEANTWSSEDVAAFMHGGRLRTPSH